MVNVNCIHCGAKVSEWTNDCQKCGKPVANPDAPTQVSKLKFGQAGTHQYKKKNSLPFILSGILAVIIIGMITYLLML